MLSNMLLLSPSFLREMKVFDHQGGDLEVVRDVFQVAKPAQLPPLNPFYTKTTWTAENLQFSVLDLIV